MALIKAVLTVDMWRADEQRLQALIVKMSCLFF